MLSMDYGDLRIELGKSPSNLPLVGLNLRPLSTAPGSQIYNHRPHRPKVCAYGVSDTVK